MGVEGMLEPALFRYFEEPTSGVPKGTIAINEKATVVQSEQLRENSPKCFVITSQDADQPKPVTTVLEAENVTELEKWMSALREAINSSARRGAPKSAKQKREEAELHKRSPQQLRMLLEYMNA